MQRTLPASEVEFLIGLQYEEVNLDAIVSFFADTIDLDYKKSTGKLRPKKSRFNTNDAFVLPKGTLFNETPVKTTVGRFIFNKVVLEPRVLKAIGYQNTVLNSSTVGKLDDLIALRLQEGALTTEDMADYIDRLQKLSMMIHPIISGSMTPETIKPNKAVIARRDQLVKENKEALDNGDSIVAAKIEKELVDMQIKVLGDDPGMDLYNSGARGSAGNNLKNMIIMKGPIMNPSTGGFDIVTSNFVEGIRKEDIPAYANNIVTGAYPKAVGTATAGYFSKQIVAGMQTVVAGPKGSKCNTVRPLTTYITDSNKKEYRGKYIIDAGKEVILTDDNISKYIGKPIQMYSPMYCTYKDAICNRCLGDQFYILNIKNVGMSSSRVSGTLLNTQMKKFHDTTIKLYRVDPTNLFI